MTLFKIPTLTRCECIEVSRVSSLTVGIKNCRASKIAYFATLTSSLDIESDLYELFCQYFRYEVADKSSKIGSLACGHIISQWLQDWYREEKNVVFSHISEVSFFFLLHLQNNFFNLFIKKSFELKIKEVIPHHFLRSDFNEVLVYYSQKKLHR